MEEITKPHCRKCGHSFGAHNGRPHLACSVEVDRYEVCSCQCYVGPLATLKAIEGTSVNLSGEMVITLSYKVTGIKSNDEAKAAMDFEVGQLKQELPRWSH